MQVFPVSVWLLGVHGRSLLSIAPRDIQSDIVLVLRNTVNEIISTETHLKEEHRNPKEVSDTANNQINKSCCPVRSEAYSYVHCERRQPGKSRKVFLHACFLSKSEGRTCLS